MRKKYSITLLQQQSIKQHKILKPLQQKHPIPQQKSSKNRKLNKTANTSLMLSTCFPSNSITISHGQIQHETQELPSQKMEKPSQMSNMHFFHKLKYQNPRDPRRRWLEREEEGRRRTRKKKEREKGR
jgi:hypothetical protein